MLNTSLLPRNFSHLVEPFSFSTFQLLRSRNHFNISSTAADPIFYHNLIKNSQVQTRQDAVLLNNYDMERNTSISPVLEVIDSPSDEQLSTEVESTREIVLNKTQHFIKSAENESLKLSLQKDTFPLPNVNNFPLSGASETLLNHQAALPAFEYLTPGVRNISPVDFPLMELNRVGGMFPPAFLHRRPRGEKRPIPEEQKDNKYYERRKRNNEAAKKSRDARKIREDRIAFRAAFLEQENSLLRAQVMALKDELQTMRQIIGKNI